MIIRSRAPLRISFGGGGTDIPPFPEQEGGVTLSTTIDKYAVASIEPRDDNEIELVSLNEDIIDRYNANHGFDYSGYFGPVKAAIKAMEINRGFRFCLSSDARPGTGLGSSSALISCTIGALAGLIGRSLSSYEHAELGFKIEREEFGNRMGRQDHYASAFGGFNLVEYHGDKTIVNPLRINNNTLHELEYRLLLCYTGRTRLSAGIIADQTARYINKDADTTGALREVKALAYRMKDSLLLGKIDEFGLLLHETWCQKKKFSPKITNPQIDELYELARREGAIGGKLLGAGGGGYLLLLCQFDKKHKVGRSLERAGGHITDFSFDSDGLQVWQVTE